MVENVSKGRPRQWLSLSQASRMLGVNEVTLRHWSNRELIRSFRTPGGHRRFSVEDIYNLMSGELPIDQGNGYDEVREKTIAGVRRKLRYSRGLSHLRRLGLNEGERAQMRLWGRRLVELVMEYMASSRSRPRLMEEARSIGESYGSEAARNGMSLAGTMEAFLFFRRPIEDMVKGLASEKVTESEGSRLWQRINDLMDQVLLALALGYENGMNQRWGPGSP
ncbi:MAG: binding domain protein, excisionase family [Dehalococcoidia bacterium]|nr:binding domain protein, excisionase family [Dehalococcoidia bacterium]